MGTRINRWRLLKRADFIAKSVGSIASLFAILWGAVEWGLHSRNERQADTAKQLSSLGTFGDMLKKTNAMEVKVNKWMTEKWPLYATSEAQAKLMENYRSGANIYYSDEMSDFREIHMFFESLGVIIDRKVLFFDAFFDSVTFPTNYEQATRGFQKWLGDNWFGVNCGVPRFAENLQRLAQSYAQKRAEQFDFDAKFQLLNTEQQKAYNLQATYWKTEADTLAKKVIKESPVILLPYIGYCTLGILISYLGFLWVKTIKRNRRGDGVPGI